jgi:hypothetical protein
VKGVEGAPGSRRGMRREDVEGVEKDNGEIKAGRRGQR